MDDQETLWDPAARFEHEDCEAAINRLRAENEKLRRAVVWLMANGGYTTKDQRNRHHIYYDTGPTTGEWVEFDGTDAGLLAAIDEAEAEKT